MTEAKVIKDIECDIYISPQGLICADNASDIMGKYTISEGLKYPSNTGWVVLDDKIQIHTDDNAIYVGDEKDGLKHGIGICTYPDGSAYDGMWQNGLKHGSGIYLFSGNSFTHIFGIV